MSDNPYQQLRRIRPRRKLRGYLGHTPKDENSVHTLPNGEDAPPGHLVVRIPPMRPNEGNTIITAINVAAIKPEVDRAVLVVFEERVARWVIVAYFIAAQSVD